MAIEFMRKRSQLDTKLVDNNVGQVKERGLGHRAFVALFGMDELGAEVNEVVKNEVVKNEVVKNEVVKNELVKNELVKNEVVKNELVKNEVVKNELVKNELVRRNASAKAIIQSGVGEAFGITLAPNSVKIANGYKEIAHDGKVNSDSNFSHLVGCDSRQGSKKDSMTRTMKKSKDLLVKIQSEAEKLASGKYGGDLVHLVNALCVIGKWEQKLKEEIRELGKVNHSSIEHEQKKLDSMEKGLKSTEKALQEKLNQELKDQISKSEAADPSSVKRKQSTLEHMKEILDKVNEKKTGIETALKDLCTERDTFIKDCIKDLNIKYTLEKMENVAMWKLFGDLALMNLQTGMQKAQVLGPALDELIGKVLKGMVENKIY
jgi:hypothetical protein